MSVSPRKQPPPSPPVLLCVVRYRRGSGSGRETARAGDKDGGRAAVSGNGPTVGWCVVCCVVPASDRDSYF